MNGSDAVPIVRVPNRDRGHIPRALEMGAMGAVRASGWWRGGAIVHTRASRPTESEVGRAAQRRRTTPGQRRYLERANDNILVCLILETRDAVENLEEICEVPGVRRSDHRPLGSLPGLGLDPRKLPLPEIEDISRKALEIARPRGVEIGVSAGSPEGLRERQRQGFTFIQYGPDYNLFVSAVTAGLEAFEREALTSPQLPLHRIYCVQRSPPDTHDYLCVKGGAK